MSALALETLTELEQKLAKASPRPWVAFRARDSKHGAPDWIGVTRDLAVDYDPDIFVSQRCKAEDADLIAAAVNALRALLDAVAERDALAARLEGAEAWIEVQDAHERLVIAERDEAMRALGKLTAERDAAPDRIADLTAERDALRAERDALLTILDDSTGRPTMSDLNGWHKLDCSRRRTARAIDGAES